MKKIVFSLLIYFIILSNSYGMMLEEENQKYPLLILKTTSPIKEGISGASINDVILNNGTICLLNPNKEMSIYLQDFLHEDYKYHPDINFSNFDLLMIQKSFSDSSQVSSAFIMKNISFKNSIMNMLKYVDFYNIRKKTNHFITSHEVKEEICNIIEKYKDDHSRNELMKIYINKSI